MVYVVFHVYCLEQQANFVTIFKYKEDAIAFCRNKNTFLGVDLTDNMDEWYEFRECIVNNKLVL